MTQDIRNRLALIAERLKLEYGAKAVILFGSYASGTDGPDSDIDLMISAETEAPFFQRMAVVRGLLRDLRKGLAIAPIILTPREIAHRRAIGDPFITDILEHGLPL
jgi:predicted nucleotidyltransferase